MSNLSKCIWDIKEFSAIMESCYKLYTWINDTILMLLLQVFWKMSQISEYFKERSEVDENPSPIRTLDQMKPLTKESKHRRHIRSMSDVQSSTPYYRLTHRLRKGSNPNLMYDSDNRSKRHHYRSQEIDSTDSSDYFESMRKSRRLEQNILKHTDSMRIL